MGIEYCPVSFLMATSTRSRVHRCAECCGTLGAISHPDEQLNRRDEEWPPPRGPAKPRQIYPLSLSTLAGFSNLHATDERDKIFALWSFIDVNALEADLLMLRYSLGTGEVFTRAAAYMAKPRRDLSANMTRGCTPVRAKRGAGLEAFV